MFQSLKGLQPKWNNHHYMIESWYTHVSIPKRVTAKVERVLGNLGSGITAKFQSLKGLQPKWNGMAFSYRDSSLSVSIPKRVTAKVELAGDKAVETVSQFQSLKGLQPKWNC